MRRLLLSTLLALALGSCASAGAAQRYAGLWEFHFETSSFRTRDGRGPWWLHAEGAQWEALTAPLAGRGPWGQVEIVVEGDLSGPGQYGHLGAYERELRVTRVISARLLQAFAPPAGN